MGRRQDRPRALCKRRRRPQLLTYRWTIYGGHGLYFLLKPHLPKTQPRMSRGTSLYNTGGTSAEPRHFLSQYQLMATRQGLARGSALTVGGVGQEWAGGSLWAQRPGAWQSTGTLTLSSHAQHPWAPGGGLYHSCFADSAKQLPHTRHICIRHHLLKEQIVEDLDYGTAADIISARRPLACPSGSSPSPSWAAPFPPTLLRREKFILDCHRNPLSRFQPPQSNQKL